jgi:F-type H+-transporting ATPase subunit alpha
MQNRAVEISEIIKRNLQQADQPFDSFEIGTILSVGDGIARVYGLENVKAGEWVDIIASDGSIIRGIAENLEVDHVGVVIVGSDQHIREGNQVKRTRKIVNVNVGKGANAS